MNTIATPFRNVVPDVEPNMFASYGSKTWNDYNPATGVLTSDNSTFVTEGVQPGMVLFNPEDSTSWATIQSVDSETELTLNGGFIYESSGGTRLSRFSIATAAVAFKQYCTDTESSKYWWANYKVGDRVQSEGQQVKTGFNKAVATIVEMEWDEVNDLAVMTLDKPLQSNRALWVYKEGNVYTYPIEKIQSMELYSYYEAGEGSEVYMTLNDARRTDNVTITPWLREPSSREEVQSVAKELEDKVINAIQRCSRSPWPTGTVMIEDSYGLTFES